MQIDEVDLQFVLSNMKPNTGLRFIVAKDKLYGEFTTNKNIKVLIHRFIMDYVNGGGVIDHIDGNTLNNCRSNLRISTYSRNMINRRRFAGYKTTTKLHHISFKKRANSFYVRIVKDRVEYSKGGFKTIEEAIEYHKSVLPILYPAEYKTIFEQNGYAFAK